MEKKIEIIFENEQIVILNKPAGLVVDEVGKSLVISHQSLAELPRNGLVHRLDKGTSGLLVVAKNQEYLDKLKKEFKERRVKKTYWALLVGKASESGGIKVPIGRPKGIFGKFGVVVDGKAAETWFRVMKYYRREDKIYSLVEIDLKTGRTHQIRVHFNYLGWPLVGDKLYGGGTGVVIERPFLQSKRLEIVGLKFEVDLAPDLKEELKNYVEI